MEIYRRRLSVLCTALFFLSASFFRSKAEICREGKDCAKICYVFLERPLRKWKSGIWIDLQFSVMATAARDWSHT